MSTRANEAIKRKPNMYLCTDIGGKDVSVEGFRSVEHAMDWVLNNQGLRRKDIIAFEEAPNSVVTAKLRLSKSDYKKLMKRKVNI